MKCGKRFTTYERIEVTDFIVIKKGGRRERFDREKLKNSILKACDKLPISYKTINKVLDGIEAKIKSMGKNEIKTKLIGDLVMEKLRELNEVAYVRFASYYKHFTDIESFEKELKKLKVVEQGKQDSTEISLMVSTPKEVAAWNRERIVNALIRETGISEKEADEIAFAVEKKVFSSGIKTISVGLIRELVNNELFVRGYQSKLESQEIIGMPVFNLSQVIFSKTLENSNIAYNNPEAVNLAIAENSLKEFALRKIFSKDVAESHLTGAIHIHNLGFPTRVYCSAHSLEFLKKYGLRLLNLSTASSPAKYAMTLTGHLNTFLATMQAYYAGALGIGYINIFYAPLLKGMSYREIKQQAQYLIFSCSQNAFSRGGQSLVPEETIWIKENGLLKQVKIGELVDKTINTDKNVEIREDGTEISRVNPNNLEGISFDEKGNIKPVKITAFARIPYKGKIYSIITSKGEIKGVTGSHSVFVWDGKRFAPKEAKELKPNDYIVAALNTKDIVPKHDKINFAEYYLSRKESENEIRVYDVEKRFKKALIKKFGKKFYEKYEKTTGVKSECVRSNWIRYNKIPLKKYIEVVGSITDEKLIYMGDSQATFPAVINPPDSFVKILGYYVSEGHDNPNRDTFAAISNKDPKIIEEIKSCLNGLNYSYAVANNGGNVKSVCIQGILGKIISDLCENGDTKQIPCFVFNLSNEKQNLFLNSFYNGDGLRARKVYAIANTSENVVNGISMLLAQHQRDFHLFKKSYETDWNDIFEIRESDVSNRIIDHKLDIQLLGRRGFRKKLKNLKKDIEKRFGKNPKATQEVELLSLLMNADVGFSRIKEIKTYDYEGYVYDISTPPHQSFLGGIGLIFFHNTLFIDFNIHLSVPSYLKETPAIGPKGKYMLQLEDGRIESLDDVPRDKEGYVIQPEKGRILTYGDFEKEAQDFARALLDVWREGDSDGKPFPFPKCDLHVNQECFNDPMQLELLKYACQVASDNGAPYFCFDRGDEANLSQCCRLRTKITDNYMLTHPESMRFCGFQNVTLNLPQAAYRAGEPNHGNVKKVIEEVEKTIEKAVKAHLQKKRFIESTMVPGSPMWQVGMVSPDGKPYIDLEQATYIIGMIGLNECVKYITGKELHEDEEAYKTGLKIISAMYFKAKEMEKINNLKFCLEESPAESSSMRLARVDMQKHPQSIDYVKGNKKTGEVYYTNSIHFAPDAPIDILKRIEGQAKFNPIIESGAITHVFLGEQKPDPESVFNLVKKTWENTQSAQLVISPEFTFCYNCHKVSRGYGRAIAVPIATNGGEIDGSS